MVGTKLGWREWAGGIKNRPSEASGLGRGLGHRASIQNVPSARFASDLNNATPPRKDKAVSPHRNWANNIQGGPEKNMDFSKIAGEFLRPGKMRGIFTGAKLSPADTPCTLQFPP